MGTGTCSQLRYRVPCRGAIHSSFLSQNKAEQTSVTLASNGACHAQDTVPHQGVDYPQFNIEQAASIGKRTTNEGVRDSMRPEQPGFLDRCFLLGMRVIIQMNRGWTNDARMQTMADRRGSQQITSIITHATHRGCVHRTNHRPHLGSFGGGFSSFSGPTGPERIPKDRVRSRRVTAIARIVVTGEWRRLPIFVARGSQVVEPCCLYCNTPLSRCRRW